MELLLSQPPPQEIPQVNAIADNGTFGGVEYIYILHDGGNPLTPMETVIRIDGRSEPVPPEDIELVTEDGSVESASWTSGDWSVGKTLRIKDNQPPQSVSLIYSGDLIRHCSCLPRLYRLHREEVVDPFRPQCLETPLFSINQLDDIWLVVIY